MSLRTLVLDALRQSGDGLTRTEIAAALDGQGIHYARESLWVTLSNLHKAGKIWRPKEGYGERWRLVGRKAA